MQVSATANAPTAIRNSSGDAVPATALANGRDDASRRASDNKADQARESQARQIDEASATARPAEPEAPASVAVGGNGELRGSQLDITI